MSTTDTTAEERGPWANPDPPVIQGYRYDTDTWIHQLLRDRIAAGRDLKVVITARNAQTGTGKTTLSGWLAMNWHWMLAGEEWDADAYATYDVDEYRNIYARNERSVLFLDEAQQLDARRSMQSENVQFSHDWMLMRFNQNVSIITMPSWAALDTRMQELADVWVNVERRGAAQVHRIMIGDYDEKLRTRAMHYLSWPDVSEHPEIQKCDQMKADKIGRRNDTSEQQDPEEAARETKIEIAQRMRDNGKSTYDIGDALDMSAEWVRQNTDG